MESHARSGLKYHFHHKTIASLCEVNGHCHVTFGVLIDLAFVQTGALVAHEIHNITEVHEFQLSKMHSLFVISEIVLIAMEVFSIDGLFRWLH